MKNLKYYISTLIVIPFIFSCTGIYEDGTELANDTKSIISEITCQSPPASPAPIRGNPNRFPGNCDFNFLKTLLMAVRLAIHLHSVMFLPERLKLQQPI